MIPGLFIPNAVSPAHAEALQARRRARPGERNRANAKVTETLHAALREPPKKDGEGTEC